MITFLIGTHNRPDHLRALLSSLIVQTDPRWRAVVLDEGYDPDAPMATGYTRNLVATLGDARIEWRAVGPYHADWHQTVRDEAAQRVDNGWICFPADDAYYAPRFVQWMIAACVTNGWHLAYCDWVYDGAGYQTWQGAPLVGRIDVGGFIVTTEAFRAVGWPWRDHEGDGRFVRSVVDAGFDHGRCAHVLYVKN